MDGNEKVRTAWEQSGDIIVQDVSDAESEASLEDFPLATQEINSAPRPSRRNGGSMMKRSFKRAKSTLSDALERLAGIPDVDEEVQEDDRVETLPRCRLETLPLRRSSWVAVGGGADIDDELVRVSNDDLQEAALRGDIGLVRRLVLAGASVNAPMRPENDDNFMTLLHVLASKPEVPSSTRLICEIVRMLANIDARTTSGVTPLACACLSKHIGGVEVLLDARADVTPVDDMGRNAVHCSIQLAHDDDSFTQEQCVEAIRLIARSSASLDDGGDAVPVVEAVREQHDVIVKGLIENNATPDGLHIAVEHAPVSLIRVLTEAEANPFKRDHRAKTVMDLALARGNPEILTLLRSYIGDLQRKGHAHVKTQKDEMAASAKRDAENVDQNCGQLRRRSNIDAVKLPRRAWIPERVLKKVEIVHYFARKLNRNKHYQATMFTVLILALFLPDFWIMANIVNTDVLDAFLIVIVMFFTVEFLVQVVGLWRAYVFTFFFWMDLVGILSVPLDHSAVNSLMPNGAADNAVVMRAARMAKLGARAGRFTKLVKLLRFLPGMKDQGAQNGTAKLIAGKLNMALSTRVSCLIIIVVMFMALVDLFRFPGIDNSMKAWAEVLQDTVSEFSPQVSDVILDLQHFYADEQYFPFSVRCVSKNGTIYDFNVGRRPSRESSIMKVIPENSNDAYMLYNFEDVYRIDSVCNCALIIMIIVAMMGSALVMSNAVSALVLVPMELLLTNVKKIASTIFKSVASMVKKAEEEADNQEDDEASDTEALDGDGFGNDTKLFDMVLKKLEVLSMIATTKSPIEDQEQLGANDRAMLQNLISSANPAGPLEQDDDMYGELTLADVEVVLDNLQDALQTHELNMDDFKAWDFHLLDSPDEVRHVMCLCAMTMNHRPSFGDPEIASTWSSQCNNFLHAVSKGYNPNPYHNFAHAADTCLSTSHFLERSGADYFFSFTERFALVVGAIGHDLGHEGVSNPFLIETSDPLAIRYNDNSPLENMHSALLFQILSDADCAIFSDMTKAQYREARLVAIEAILHTDAACHVGLVKEFQNFYDMNHELFDANTEMFQIQTGFDVGYPPTEVREFFSGDDVREQLRNAVLRFCDLSSPMKPWEICSAWADLFLQEQLAQGDREKELGLAVTPLNDREKASLPYSQIGYIEFIVAPLALSMERLMPSLDIFVDILFGNLGKWVDEWVHSTDPPPEDYEQAKVLERIAKLEGKRKM